tara:strand:+ start:7995 stop:8435 length:441 start_codon:yes stop_codon:yes gene_type:complete
MSENLQNREHTECTCDIAGYCPVYQQHVSEGIRHQCKSDQSNRDFYLDLFRPDYSENGLARQEEKKDLSIAKATVDKAIKNLKTEGIDLDEDDNIVVSDGLGDKIEKVLSKFGITTEMMQKVSGLKDCGCNKRKEWLNKIFGYKGD